MKLATLVVVAYVLLLQGCVFTNAVLGSVDTTDIRTIKVTRGDTVYELSGDLEGFEDFDEMHKLIDKLPKD